MTTLLEIWKSIDDFLLRGIFVSVAVLIITKILFKGKIDVHISFRIVRMIFVLHSLIYIAILLFFLLLDLESSFLTRVTGPYWWAYASMMFFNAVLPLTVLIKKIGNKAWYLFLIAVLINIGWIFESLIIRSTAMHRENMSVDYNPYLPTPNEMTILIKGFIIGVLLLVVGNVYVRITEQKRNAANGNPQ